METIKKRVTDYWTQRAESFEEQRLREYNSEKKERWLEEMNRYLPEEKPLRILDIGTGTGFLACLLASQGHTVTGIDLTPDMITHAGHMASSLNLDARFQVMDAESPDFAPETFDAVVTRNLTWTLPHLEKAYREWYRLLKPGGILMNFDADYYAAVCTGRPAGKLPEKHAHMLLPDAMMKENEAITREVGKGHKPRPFWDIQLLWEIGFNWICADQGIYRRIYAEMDEFFNPTPIFLIAAYK